MEKSNDFLSLLMLGAMLDAANNTSNTEQSSNATQVEQEDIIYKTPVKVGDGLEIIGSGKEDYVIVAINGQQTYVPFASFGSQVKEQVIKSLMERLWILLGCSSNQPLQC